MIRFKIYNNYSDFYFNMKEFTGVYLEIQEFIEKSAVEVSDQGPRLNIFETNDKIGINYLLIKYPRYVELVNEICS